MRGKVIERAQCEARLGITPAHAGKSIGGGVLLLPQGDHPRPCGEKVAPLLPAELEAGSPPPMRGQGCCRRSKTLPARITPAHAGKRVRRGGGVLGLLDHPRPCGEKSMQQHRAMSKTGSPPPMRGKATIKAKVQAQRRITPAHAGKSLSKALFLAHLWDHPRPCGEK